MKKTIQRYVKPILALYISIVLVAITGCIIAPVAPNPTPSTPSGPTGAANPVTIPGITNTPGPVLPDFVSVITQVRPSVVAINIEVITYDIFNRPVQQQGAGSGWILDSSGLIVTNNHVVEGAETINVVLYNGSVVPAKLVGADALTDIAVIQIDAPNLTPIPIGDSDNLQVGEWILTVGNSLGLGITAKEGIVSRTGVSLPVSAQETVDNLVEVSAAINPGNSGGPLVNMRGEVVGINSIKIATSGVEGMGYAISSRAAEPIIQELVKQGYVIRPWLGVAVRDVDENIAAYFDLSVVKGVLVTQVSNNSPASRAGLQQGDVIVEMKGNEINTSTDLRDIIHESQVGEEISIVYVRNGTRYTTTAALSEVPAP